MRSRLVVVGEMLGTLSGSAPGRLHVGDAFRLSFAGAEGNVGIVAARQGTPVSWIGRLGDDPLGQLIHSGMRAEGVDVRGVIVDPDAYTALLLKSRRTADTTTVSYFRRDAAGARLRADDIRPELFSDAGCVHLTGITPALSDSAAAATETAVRYARDASALVSFDVNYRRALCTRERASDLLTPLARRADIVFASPDELELVAASPQELLDHGVREVVVKDGSRGAVVHSRHGLTALPAHSVTTVDSVGAGDAFVGGYLSARIAGEDSGAALARAVASGAFAVSTLGDWEGAPSRDEMSLLSSDDVVR